MLALEVERHAGADSRQRVSRHIRDAVDTVKHAVGVEHHCGVEPNLVPFDGAVDPIRPERELTAVAVVKPRDRGRDRHAVFLEQSRVVHDDEQPLRQELAVGAAKLRHVGVHGELLARHHQVRVRDRRLDDIPAVNRPRRIHERGMTEKRLDAGDARVLTVRVLLAEIARADRERLHRFVGTRESPGAKEVRHRVVPLREPVSDVGVELLVLGIHAVATEALAEVDHSGGVGRVVEERIEANNRRSDARGA